MGGQFSSSSKVSLPRVNPADLINDKSIPEGSKDSLEVPGDQFLCPLCGKIPEILNVHSDNGHLELKCSYHGLITISIKDYYRHLKESIFTYYKIKCANCNEEQRSKENMFSYCFYCKADFCEECVNNFNLTKFNEHRRKHLDVCIPVNEKPHRCLEHYNSDINVFCADCQEHICDKEPSKKHKEHTKINLMKYEDDIAKYIDIITEKNKILSDIIRFNQLILNTYDKFKNNYFHIQSLINLGKSIEEENARDTKELRWMINKLENTHKAQKDAIKTLQEEFEIDLTGEETKVSLYNRKLGDKGFKLLSLIKFTKLKDLNLAENGISNLEPLYNMNLPELEYINLSNNEIKDAKPLAEFNSKKLKEIALQKNKIKDFTPFLKSEFPCLEMLRIETNDFDKDDEAFKKFLKKYNKQVIHTGKTLKQFNDEYGLHIGEKMEEIDLTGLRAGDKILKDLYLILDHHKTIKRLNLQNNNIKDASIISRFPLKKLQFLDLSLNEITNLKFLTEMKCAKLTQLYLNDNKINNIIPLIQLNDPDLYIKDEKDAKNGKDGKDGKDGGDGKDGKDAKDAKDGKDEKVVNNITSKNFPELTTISLKNNNLIDEEKQNQKVLLDLNSKGITTDIKDIREINKKKIKNQK